MAEYIEREAAVKAFNNFDAGRADSPPFTLLTPEEFAEYLYEFPAADVAPVVRCKDCKHYRNYPNGLCYLHTEPKTNARGYSGDEVCVEPDDFCSYGERKNGGEGDG